MFQNVRLQTRFTIFILIITLPLLSGSLYFLNNRASKQIDEQANQALRNVNNTIATDANTWLEQQYRALQQTANLPDVVSMEPRRQKNALIAMARAHPNLYLVHTLDLNGFNVARSDDAEPNNYSDREYYQSVISGEPIAYQVVIGRTSGQPALVLAIPVLDENSNIIGVASSAGLLDDISLNVTRTVLGESGIIFIVDAKNQVIAHTNPVYTTDKLQNFSEYPPVAALRQGKKGLIYFTDEEGTRWRAYTSQIENGWGIVTQQSEEELLAPIRAFHTFTLAITIAGLVFLIVLSTYTIQRIVTPIKTVTETARSIAVGNFFQRIAVKSKDEIGQLGEAFNMMASQIQDLVADLETRVAERTAELETASQQVKRRAEQFEAIAQVSRIISSIQNQEDLFKRITRMISQHFGFYHVGIFLLDDNRQFAVLRAANSQGGQKMLARKHRLEVGQTGIVGYVTSTGNPRIALDTGADAVYFDNPDLPDTRSEMSLPLKSGSHVIGALDVQSREPNAFSQEDINILSALADQVSAALENARLHEETQEALAKSETAYRQLTGETWSNFQRIAPVVGYRFDGIKAERLDKPTNGGQPKGQQEAYSVPVQLRGESIGILRIKPASDGYQWTDDDIAIIQATAERLALAAENARLVAESQRRASKEKVIGEVTTKIGSSVHLRNVLQTAVEELGRNIPGSEIVLQLASENKTKKETENENLL